MNIYEKYGRLVDKLENLNGGYLQLLKIIKDIQAGKLKLEQLKITDTSYEVLD